jgi:serine phosphatase RsbU (regulator of sigma subunit)/predicted enzyme related to lactoylglutathione lyase
MSDVPQVWVEEPASKPEAAHLYLRVQSVNIYVRDLEKSLHFYRDQLGFAVAWDVILQSGQRWVGVTPPDGTAVLALIAPPEDSEEYKLIGRPTEVVFVTEDVAAKYGEWRKRGVRFGHTPRLRRVKYQQNAAVRRNENPSLQPIWGGVFTRFEDPDHNSFALVSLDEVSRAIEAQRRKAAEKAESDRRAARELEIAKEVQLKLFPQTLPMLKTLEYAGVCIQARQVGGDYYDFLDMGREHLGLVLSDISGKGIAAALLMANLQANFRSQCAIAIDEPLRLLCSVNRLFCENTADSAFATVFFAEYDNVTRRLRYANCGHLPPLLLHDDDSLDRLAATATILGAFKEWDCTLAECQLSPGDTLVLYTDGITESFSPDGEEFGEERLIDVLRQNCKLPCSALRSAIVDQIRHHFSPHDQHDDITLIIAKCL